MNHIVFVLGIVLVIFISFIYYRFAKKMDIIKSFPRFFQEIYNNTSSGMSLIEAIRKSKEGCYGSLTPLIKNMCLQIEWGVPFVLALKNFRKKANNDFIEKIVTLTEKSSEFSPDISKSMKDIYDYINLTKEFERERRTELFPQLISLYFVFFVFLGIIFVIFNFFIPSFQAIEALEYKIVFQHLIIIESIFSGLVIGKITDGSYITGLKHTIILVFISLIFLFIL